VTRPMEEHPESAFVIRHATSADLAALVELARNTFRDAYRHIDDPDDIEEYVASEFTPAAFTSILADRDSILLVAHHAQHHVGYVHIKCSGAPPCVTGPAPIELARIYLRQEKIGLGYGALLMQTVHAEARRLGCATIWLGVYERNQRARNFYKRWGFVDVGTKDFRFAGKIYADPIMAAPVPPDARVTSRRT
jgi:diamine N-acetyltransferase